MIEIAFLIQNKLTKKFSLHSFFEIVATIMNEDHEGERDTGECGEERSQSDSQ